MVAKPNEDCDIFSYIVTVGLWTAPAPPPPAVGADFEVGADDDADGAAAVVLPTPGAPGAPVPPVEVAGSLADISLDFRSTA